MLKTEDGTLLLFNCKTSKMHGISSKYADDISKVLNGDIENASIKVKDFLRKNQYLELEGEYSQINKRLYEQINSRDKLRMTILPTDACNFKCIYCCQTEPYHVMDSTGERKIINFIKQLAEEYKSIYISWFGGEPLLACEKIEAISKALIDYSKSNHKPYLAEMTTNGYLLSQDVFLRLLKCKIFFYQITIDGTKEIHNKNRPHRSKNDSYEKVYDNLLQISKIDKNRRFRIIIRINITPQISNELEAVLSSFSRDFGADERFVFAVQPVRDWGGERIVQHKNDIVESLDYYTEKIELFNKYNLKLWDMNFFNFGNTFCDANYEHAYIINPNGELLRCSIAEYDEKYREINHVGFIRDNGEAFINENDNTWRKINENTSCKECCVYPLCCRATCKLGFNISKKQEACKKQEMVEYLQLFLRNKEQRNCIDEQLY